ncbi:ATP-binding cassette domain-containing protein [Pulveribacter sp.]|uniref:ATP-binding cassette domain-containing protein n=1 Tax=Pulveribacter sp. TaxID=2678893 RepID=UPI0028AE59B7|nr:ATP-binding cassette domain-containing protein [Pulveribacter sp.]
MLKGQAWAWLRALGADVLTLQRDVRRFLVPAHRRALRRIAVFSAVFSLLEMLVAAAALPYVACLGERQCGVVGHVAAETGADPVMTYSALLLALMSVKMLADMGLQWRVAGFQQEVQKHTVLRLLSAYFAQGWTGYRQRNRSDYFRRCTITAVDAAYACHLAASAIASALLVVVLTALMVVVSPWVSIALALAFLGLNGLVQRFVGARQKRAAHVREDALRRWHLGMGEALDAFQELRVHGAEEHVLQGVAVQLQALARANRWLAFMPVLPRVALDYLAFTVVLVCVLAWSWTGRPLGGLLPYLVFYAVVARSLLPAMMQLLSIRTSLRGAALNIQLVCDELAAAASHRRDTPAMDTVDGAPALRLEGVEVTHAGHAAPVLRAVSAQVERPAWVALVGPSGAGKSTLLDVVAGLQTPTRGSVVWQSDAGGPPRIAYVPQHVAILDASLRENVVFGVDAGCEDAVGEALAVAQLADKNPEQGTLQLSGGERQRLAIARAVYRKPDLLLLDEATAAMDEATEAALFESLRAALPQATVLFVTHRLASLRFAQVVWRVHEGRVEHST